MRDAAQARGRFRPRQDRDHRIRVPASGQDAQPLERRTHAWGLFLRLGRCGGARPHPGRARDADQRFGDPSRGVLRRGRLQAHGRRAALCRREHLQPHARYAGHLRSQRRGLRARRIVSF